MSQLNSYKRRIGPLGLTFSAISAMIGSGWLFSSLYVGEIAGPASIIAWVLGGALVFIIALTYAEISSMVPVSGGSTRFPQLTHGTFVSLFFGWITWFNLMTAPAIETQAMLQYASDYWPTLLNADAYSGINSLSHSGYFVAFLTMLTFSIINIYSIKLITRINNYLTFFKITIAIMTTIVLVGVAFHAHNFHNATTGGFAPHGIKGIFVAIATGGILFAFNGFKQVVELAGEAKNPKRTVLIAITASLIGVLLIYLALQIAFIGALPKSALTHGWSHLQFHGDAGPLVGILLNHNIRWMAALLSINAIIATSAAGLVFSTSAARTLYGLSANRQLPKFLQEVTKRGIPAKAVAVNFLIGMTFFLPFHGWYAMAEFMSSIIALSYLTGPVCALSLRYQLPNKPRIFRLPMIKLWCFLGFYICTLIVYWTGWEVVSKLGLCLFVSFILFVIYRVFSDRPRGVDMSWLSATWMWPYLVGLNIISYLGSYGGGHGIIPFGWDFVLLALLSALCLYLAIHFRNNDHHVKDTLVRLEEEAETGIPMAIPDDAPDFATK